MSNALQCIDQSRGGRLAFTRQSRAVRIAMIRTELPQKATWPELSNDIVIILICVRPRPDGRPTTRSHRKGVPILSFVWITGAKYRLAPMRVPAVVSMGCPVIKNYVSGIRSVDSNQAPECLNVKTPPHRQFSFVGSCCIRHLLLYLSVGREIVIEKAAARPTMEGLSSNVI